MKYLNSIILIIYTIQIVNANVLDDSVFTLYRNNNDNPFIRIHLATFDSSNGEQFNLWYCQKAVQYFQEAAKSRGSNERIWCEKGYFRE